MELKPLNINLLLSQNYAAQSYNQVPAEEVNDSVTALIETLLGDEYSEVVLTNKYTSATKDRGFYSLLIRKNLLRYLAVCSIKKMDFRLIPNEPSFVLNGRTVDASFLSSFQSKLTKVISDYKNGVITITGKRKEGGDNE